jgi:tetratricopeptide (TPR) repeat protein
LNNNNFIEYEPDAETVDLIRRYEDVVHRKSNDYFDEDEFEMIIDHYLSLNKSKEAVAAADRGSAQYPYSSELKLRYADVLIIKGDSSQALQLLQHVEQMGVNDCDVHFLKARAYVQQGKFKEAEIDFAKSWQTEERVDERQRICLVAAGDYLEAREYNLAIRYFLQALERNPHHEQALNDVAYCYDRLDDFQNSVHYYERCLAVNPFNEAAWYNLGNVYSRNEEYEKALQAFDFSIAIEPNNAPVLFNRATTLIVLERFHDAIDSFNEFLVLEPNNAQGLCALAECYENLDCSTEALKHYTQAIGIDPQCADAYYGKGLILMEYRHYDVSLDYIYRALHIDSDNAEYYYGMGVLLLRINADHVAMQAFRRATDLDPYDMESWLILSELSGSTDLHHALEVLDEACIHNPDEPAIYFRKAALYYILKDTEACFATLEKALTIDPSGDDDFLTICPEAITDENVKALYSRYKKQI